MFWVSSKTLSLYLDSNVLHGAIKLFLRPGIWSSTDSFPTGLLRAAQQLGCSLAFTLTSVWLMALPLSACLLANVPVQHDTR